MISRAQDIVYNQTGQVVSYICPQGRPSSVTSVAVYDQGADDDSTAESALGTPSVTTNPNTTVDAPSGAGQSNPYVLNVAATTGFESTRDNPAAQYLVTGANGEREWFQVLEVASGASLVLTAPLYHAYASADTVKTTRIQATIDATWVADKSNISGAYFNSGATPRWRCRWTYVVSSVTYVADSYFDLVRYPANHEVTALDIENYLPGWMELLPENHEADQGQRLIDDGNRKVRVALVAAGKADQLVRDDELMNHLTVLATIEQWNYARYQQSGNPNLRQAWVDSDAVFNGALDQLVRVTTRVPMSLNQGGAAAKTVGSRLWRR